MKQYWSPFAVFCGLIGCGSATVAREASQPEPLAAAPATSVEPPGFATSDTSAPADATTTAASGSTNPSSPVAVQEPGKTGDSTDSTDSTWPSGTKVLQVGDSFAGALGLPLGKLLEEAGIKSVLKHTDASYLTDWAWNGELQKMLWKYNPDLLIITLGANELAITEPEQRIKTVAKIISLVGDRPCLWVAIPLWQGKHNGLMDVIRDNVGHCTYWDSNRLLDVEHMPRIADGIHPTTEARAEWAKIVFQWLGDHRAPTSQHVWTLAP